MTEPYDFRYHLPYWDQVGSSTNPFGDVRHGWSRADFKTRTDETLISTFEVELKPTDSFLDLGCGLGYVCKMVSPRVKEYVGVDWSVSMLNTAAQLNPYQNAQFVLNDGESIPFLDGTFDHVISECVFIHIEPATQLRYMDEAWRVLKRGGGMYFQIPKVSSYVNGLKIEQLAKWKDPVLKGSEDDVCFYFGVKKPC
jgi:ubiquinone/menaquinone biosynthesis C-methylase UbiE